jgi:integral membrane protein (TIGR01906 family)
VAKWWDSYLHAIGRGGLLTTILLGAGILFVLVAFGIFFVLFHQVFFQAGTWQFFYSDTLIRLFPERFWRDSFLVVGAFSGIAGLLLWYFLVKRR